MRITDTHRQAVKQAHAEGKTRNQIARDIGISPGSVTTICKDADLTFDRTATKKATEARLADTKALRTSLSAESLTVAQDALRIIKDLLDQGDNTLRDVVTAYGVLSDKHLAFERVEVDKGVEDGKSMVSDMMAGLKKMYDEGQAVDDKPAKIGGDGASRVSSVPEAGPVDS